MEYKNADIIKQLYKQPPKENPPSHRYTTEPNLIHQIDVLSVPEDKKYKYILSVVDIYNSLCDARPLKNLDMDTIKQALNNIYSTGIYLKKPSIIQCDNQFNNKDFKDWLKYKKIRVKYSAPYRSRQNSHVETLNKTLGDTILKMQLDKEIETNQTNKEWVYNLPDIINKINKKKYEQLKEDGHKKKEEKEIYINQKEIIQPHSIVRRVLDKSEDYTTGQHLTGKRSVDIKYSRQLYEVIDFYIFPNNPILYKLQEITTPYRDIMNNKTLRYGKTYPALFSSDQLQIIKV